MRPAYFFYTYGYLKVLVMITLMIYGWNKCIDGEKTITIKTFTFYS